jgi:hypothetical protein
VFRHDGIPAARILAGRSWSRRRLRAEAAGLAARGDVVSLFLFGPTTLYHRVRHDPAGFWEQSGGLFGRSDRTQPLVRSHTFRQRLADEVRRVAKVRGLPESPT